MENLWITMWITMWITKTPPCGFPTLNPADFRTKPCGFPQTQKIILKKKQKILSEGKNF